MLYRIVYADHWMFSIILMLFFLGAKVLSGEVVKIRKGNEDPEAMETTEDNRIRQKFLLALRLYLDGVYRDAPPEVLPAPSEVQEECVILWTIDCKSCLFTFLFVVQIFFRFMTLKLQLAIVYAFFYYVFAHFGKDLMLTNLEHWWKYSNFCLKTSISINFVSDLQWKSTGIWVFYWCSLY